MKPADDLFEIGAQQDFAAEEIDERNARVDDLLSRREDLLRRQPLLRMAG